MARTNWKKFRSVALPVLAFVVLALVALTAVLIALPGGGADEGVADSSRGGPQWEKGVTAGDVGRQLGVEVPEGARQRRAGLQVNPQEDVLLLSFQLPRDELGPFVEKLALEDPLKKLEPIDAEKPSAAPFGHLKLPEPETLDQVRKGSVCPPCAGNKKSRVQSLEIFTQPLGKERVRVYLRGL
ncbi:hypothetical protein [Streptomyces sp. NBC_01187]|uniref:hypothetical protein n=1 Tax=Streptomyces sp. NBC_01187 TaxID=2903766 RepID=UPI00386DF25E|nr:hypothetical protein OG220_24335 [Streptomyces sp. NBC_01187]